MNLKRKKKFQEERLSPFIKPSLIKPSTTLNDFYTNILITLNKQRLIKICHNQCLQTD